MKIADDFTLMVAAADAPYETCADVVEAAKSDRIVAGISGITGLDNVVFTLTEQQTDVEFDRVPFESGGELTAALLGDQIDIASLNPGEVIGQLESGDIKALCAYADERYATTKSSRTSRPRRSRASTCLRPVPRRPRARRHRRLGQGLLGRADGGGHRDRRVPSYIEDNFLQPNTAAGDEFVRLPGGEQRQLQEVMGE